MAFTHSLTRGWTNDASSISKRVSATAGSELNIDEIVAADGTANIVATLDPATLKCLFMVSATNMIVTFKDNGETVLNTFNLVADKPFSWITGDAALSDTGGLPVNFAAGSMSATNSDPLVDGLLQIRILSDPTP